jgi:hypothetical protein
LRISGGSVSSGWAERTVKKVLSGGDAAGSGICPAEGRSVVKKKKIAEVSKNRAFLAIDRKYIPRSGKVNSPLFRRTSRLTFLGLSIQWMFLTPPSIS